MTQVNEYDSPAPTAPATHCSSHSIPDGPSCGLKPSHELGMEFAEMHRSGGLPNQSTIATDDHRSFIAGRSS